MRSEPLLEQSRGLDAERDAGFQLGLILQEPADYEASYNLLLNSVRLDLFVVARSTRGCPGQT
ncbi:hypothetical protein ACIRU3_42370 [Streptomyces sp. NPDC101151]|uniref:hypothetical protein n=1 Tax=Streptomyces sp. NPDC101151 TaxID=3366115 RepID=UPI0038127AEF